MEPVHLLHDCIVNTRASSCISLLAFAFYAYYRHYIAALFQEVQMFFCHESPVGKDRKHYVLHLSC